MKKIGQIKTAALILWLIPFGLLISMLDMAARVCKWGYKILHAAATVVSRYIQDVMDRNGL